MLVPSLESAQVSSTEILPSYRSQEELLMGNWIPVYHGSKNDRVQGLGFRF